MLGDGYHYMEAEFKKEAMNIFKKEHGHLTFNQLRDRILYIQQWSLKVVFKDSHNTLNSYNNLSILLVVERFRPIMQEMPQQKQIHHAQNVFHEKEIRSWLERSRHQFVNSLVQRDERDGLLALGTFEMPKMTDLFCGAELKHKTKSSS